MTLFDKMYGDYEHFLSVSFILIFQVEDNDSIRFQVSQCFKRDHYVNIELSDFLMDDYCRSSISVIT